MVETITPEAVRVMLHRCGLSQTEAAALLGVEVRTVNRWGTGAAMPSGELYRPKPEYWTALLQLAMKLDRAAEMAMKTIRRQIEQAGGAPDAVHLRLAADDEDAQRLGWPSRAVHAALLARVWSACAAIRVTCRIVGDDDPAADAARLHPRAGRRPS